MFTAIGAQLGTMVKAQFKGEVVDFFASLFTGFGSMASLGAAQELIDMLTFVENGAARYAADDEATGLMSIWVDTEYTTSGTTYLLEYFYQAPLAGKDRSRELSGYAYSYFSDVFGNEYREVIMYDRKVRKPLPPASRPPVKEQ